MGFARDLERFAEKQKARMDEVLIAGLLDISEKVITSTPIETGRTRGAWIASIDSFSTMVPLSKDKNGSKTLAKIKRVLKKAPGHTFYLTNSVSWIRLLEYGGYTKTPKLGTYNKKTKKYEIRSIGGYSKHAPKGMVRVNVKNYKKAIKKAIR